MQFSELLGQVESLGEGVLALATPEDWRQGRAVFGGLQTALGLLAMRRLVPSVPVRTLQTTFVGPPTGDRIYVRARILRQGKSATHVEAYLLDGESPDADTLAVVLGVFGNARSSVVSLIPQMPVVTSENPKVFRYREGVTPTFTQHFSATWLHGKLPFRGPGEPKAVLELGMPGEAESNEYHVIALADFIPPVALSYMTTPAPGSSMTWMLEFLTDQVNGLPLEGWRVDAEMVAGADGYTSQSVMLWGPQGQPIALSRQSMVIFG
ncbi:MAG TPA: thioesterase family protein [Dongiaceae bacterium]|nr:thioesterase family protein [Dongiaceae bacterium]